jgi:hypothetical protein
MLAVHLAGAEPDTQNPDLPAVAERALRSSPYPALNKLSCEYRGGVLVLLGCLPTYYLKQIAQEVVSRQMNGVGRLDNQIHVVPAVVLESPAELDTEQDIGDSRREASPDPKRRTGMAVKMMAPFGEEIEVDG